MFDIMQLNPGEIVRHKRYGLCRVVDVGLDEGYFLGIVVIPTTKKGKILLASDGQCEQEVEIDIPLLELDVDNILSATVQQ